MSQMDEAARERERDAEVARRVEDLRVSLIRAINTALSRAGVALPTSAAATVEPELSVGVDDILQAYADRDEAIKLRDNANRERDEALAQLELWRGSQWGEIARENADLRRRAEKAEQALADLREKADRRQSEPREEGQ
jgi:hypothetical protein